MLQEVRFEKKQERVIKQALAALDPNYEVHVAKSPKAGGLWDDGDEDDGGEDVHEEDDETPAPPPSRKAGRPPTASQT